MGGGSLALVSLTCPRHADEAAVGGGGVVITAGSEDDIKTHRLSAD